MQGNEALDIKGKYFAESHQDSEVQERVRKDFEDFIYIVSHDLQEPLRMVRGFTSLLEKKYKNLLGEDAVEYINFAVDGTKRMQAMLDGLLKLSRIDTQGTHLVEVKLETVARVALHKLKAKIAESKATINMGDLPTVLGDCKQLIMLIEQLIDNAIKFRSEERPLRIDIHCGRKNNYWYFSVKDNGIGIEEKYNERVFQIFQQHYYDREKSGIGLGLALCKRIVERHTGVISVQSDFNQGSDFRFTLPVPL